MHIFFFVLVPYAIYWLLSSGLPTTDDTWPVKVHYWFVVYTTCITTISLVADIGTAIKYLRGKDVGVYATPGAGPDGSGEYEEIA